MSDTPWALRHAGAYPHGGCVAVFFADRADRAVLAAMVTTVWLNLGDTYAAKARGTDRGWEKSRLSNPGGAQKRQAASLRRTGERHRGEASGIGAKNLVGIPWRVAFALQDDGWVLRSDVIWAKPNPMPESVPVRIAPKLQETPLERAAPIPRP